MSASGPSTPVAVVLEAGLGASGATWGPVQDLLSRSVRTITYDRAGYGGSDAAGDERGLADLARDLGAVIAHLGTRHVVLVGHSWGGPIVRTYARLAPQRPAGVLLVDPSEEDADLHFATVRWAGTPIGDAVLPTVVRGGLFLRSAFSVMAAMPRRHWWPAVSGSITPRAIRAMVTEERAVTSELIGLRATPDPLDDVPLRIISAQIGARVERGQRGELLEAHRRRAEAAGGMLVPAHRSKHMVPVSEPGLIAEHALALAGR